MESKQNIHTYIYIYIERERERERDEACSYRANMHWPKQTRKDHRSVTQSLSENNLLVLVTG